METPTSWAALTYAERAGVIAFYRTLHKDSVQVRLWWNRKDGRAAKLALLAALNAAANTAVELDHEDTVDMAGG